MDERLAEGMRIRTLSKSWEGVVLFVNECRAHVKIDKLGEEKVTQYIDISPDSEVEVL